MQGIWHRAPSPRLRLPKDEGRTWKAQVSSDPNKEKQLQVFVRDNNVDQALRALKKKMQREGVFREMRAKRFYEKPSEKRAREKGEAIRRARKLARKKAQQEGLLPGPKRKPAARGAGPRT